MRSSPNCDCIFSVECLHILGPTVGILCVKLQDIASWQCQVAPRNGCKSGSTLHLERVLAMNIGKLRLNYLKPSYLIALQKVAIWSSSIWKIFSSEEHLKNPVICWCDLKFDVMKVAPWREIRKTQTNLVPNQIRRSISDALKQCNDWCTKSISTGLSINRMTWLESWS